MAKFKPLLDVVAKAIAPENSSKQHATSSSSASGSSSKGDSSRGQQPQEGGAAGTITQLKFSSLQVHFVLLFEEHCCSESYYMKCIAVIQLSRMHYASTATICRTSEAVKVFRSH
jgi:hypothetical protein